MSKAPTLPAGRPGAVLVTGASGFLGQQLVRCLSAHGVRVVGVVRSAARAQLVSRAGGSPVVADVLDAEAVRRAAEGCETFVHLASAANDESASEEHALRVRAEGVRHLAAAAGSVRGRRLVLGSGYWVYADRDGPIDEGAPVEPKGEAAANLAAEAAARETGRQYGLEVLTVRPAMVYGDGAWFRSTVDALRSGSYRLIEGGPNPWSFVSLPDTAEAFRAVLDRGASGGVYNVADGSPAPWGEFVRFLAGRLRAEPPPSISASEAVSAYGPEIAEHLRARRALRADRLRELGWSPAFRDFRAGLPPLLDDMRAGR